MLGVTTMKRIILSAMVVAFAVAVQAGDSASCQNKDKAACCPAKSRPPWRSRPARTQIKTHQRAAQARLRPHSRHRPARTPKRDRPAVLARSRPRSKPREAVRSPQAAAPSKARPSKTGQAQRAAKPESRLYRQQLIPPVLLFDPCALDARGDFFISVQNRVVARDHPAVGTVDELA